MSETVSASDGTQLPLDSLAQTFVRSGSFLSTITVTYTSAQTHALRNFIQTFTNDGTNITAISGWIAQ